jgi:aspartate aminotransferase
MYDQVYWMLTVRGSRHAHPVKLRPEMARFTITVDGASKAFAATGMRVGWTVGPPDITRQMSSIVTHVGAWAPRAEQLAAARLLDAPEEIERYHRTMISGIQSRLDALYAGAEALRDRGYPVEALPPMGAMYLSMRFALHGARLSNGKLLSTDEDIRRFLLEEAGLGVVPFGVFGVRREEGWSRLSVGAVSLEDIGAAFERLEAALSSLAFDRDLAASRG